MFDFTDSLLGLLPGLWVSLQMTAAAVAVGIPLGFLAGLALNGQRKWLRYVVMGLVEVFRGFPALLTLYLVYFGQPKRWTLTGSVPSRWPSESPSPPTPQRSSGQPLPASRKDS